MLDAIILIGLLILLLGGTILFSLGMTDIIMDGPSIKNVLGLLGGIALLSLFVYSLKETSESNHESYIKSHPVEIVTSTHARIDTTITIRNGVADTTYTYYLIKK